MLASELDDNINLVTTLLLADVIQPRSRTGNHNLRSQLCGNKGIKQTPK